MSRAAGSRGSLRDTPGSPRRVRVATGERVGGSHRVHCEGESRRDDDGGVEVRRDGAIGEAAVEM